MAATDQMLQIKSVDVTDEDLTRLEAFIEDLDGSPLAVFLADIVASLRNGDDLIVMSS